MGAVAFATLQEFLITRYPYFYMLLMGTTLIVVILFLPNGLLGVIDKTLQRINRIARVRSILARFQEAA